METREQIIEESKEIVSLNKSKSEKGEEKSSGSSSNKLILMWVILSVTSIALSISLPLTIGIKDKIKLNVEGLNNVEQNYLDTRDIINDLQATNVKYHSIGYATDYIGMHQNIIETVSLKHEGVSGIKYDYFEIKELNSYMLEVTFSEEVECMLIFPFFDGIKNVTSSQIYITVSILNMYTSENSNQQEWIAEYSIYNNGRRIGENTLNRTSGLSFSIETFYSNNNIDYVNNIDISFNQNKFKIS